MDKKEKFDLFILALLAVLCAVLVYFAIKNQNQVRITEAQAYSKFCSKYYDKSCDIASNQFKN